MDRKQLGPGSAALTAFALGALAVLLTLGIGLAVQDSLSSLANTLVAAPVIEELVKAVPLILMIRMIRTAKRGAMLGVSAGAGFGMIENLGYFVASMDTDLLLLRSFTTLPLHAAATGVLGYGIGSRRAGTAAVCLLMAIALHMAFNTLAMSAVLWGEWTAIPSLVLRIAVPAATLVLLAHRSR